jgi:hypothetical protein
MKQTRSCLRFCETRKGKSEIEMNCQTCGACCATGLLIEVDPSDTTPRRWTRSVRGVIGFASWEADQGIRQMARIGDRCAALAGQVGQSCACRVYPRRPAGCAEFRPGGPDCLDARRKLGLED